MPKKLYLIDGSGFIFRAYHALPPLTSPNGTPVGAVLGFVNITLKLLEAHQADYIAVIFDAARQTFRNRLYSEYKAHRPPAPDDLIPQFPLVREAARAMNLPAIELADFEADDIIASYAKAAQAQDIEVVIVSSDKDLMQCIGDGVTMFDPMKQKPIGAPEVMEKFGVMPDKVVEVLALIGDSSDNVPGVPGIGPKTAAELIGQFGDVENMLANIALIKQPKRREVLTQHADNARLSKELVKLNCDVPLPLPLEALAHQEVALELLLPFLQTHGFKSLMGRLQNKSPHMESLPLPPIVQPVNIKQDKAVLPVAVPTDYTIVRDEQALLEWMNKARKIGTVAFDTETTSLNTRAAELVGFSLALEPGVACYVPLLHRVEGGGVSTKQDDLFAPAPKPPTLAPGQIPFERALALIKLLLEDESVLKIGHNMKYDLLVMQRYGVAIKAYDDTMLLSYVLHAGEHGQGMDELAERYLGHKNISFDEVTGTGRERKRFDDVEIEKAATYAAEDADITLRLHQLFKPQVAAQKMLTLYETMERPLISVLARMETAGIKIDMNQLGVLSRDFGSRMQELERDIQTLAGQEFNVGSPKQLGEILFEKLQLPGGKKSAKSGAYGTGNDVLEELAEQGHEIAAKVTQWRQLSKLKSTYSDALAEQKDARSGRVHTSFAQAITSTGRLSSSDPNLQNIPIRTSEGKKIRNAFIAEPGNVLVSADYSQIELRLLAHMADIPTLKEAFRNGDDIHAITASQMFGVPVAAVDSDLRRKAKTINFGIIYGISAHGLASRLGIGRSEAGAYIERYFTQYPGIRDYMEEAKNFAKAHGYVVTLFGRRCHVPGINDKNGGVRQFSERAAINAPLQGTAADIIKRAMITIDRELATPQARLLLQVHDELVFEVAEYRVERVTPLIRSAMEQAADLSVPLTVEIGAGSHWGEAH